MTIVDGSGANISSLSGGQTGFVRVRMVDASGTPAAFSLVTFTSTDGNLISFVPSTRSAQTDATGVAEIKVQPASVTSAGAVSIEANGVSQATRKSAQATKVLSIGAAPLIVGTLSFVQAPTGKLPAFSTVALNIPVTSAGQPATSITGLTLTSLCTGDGTATLVPGSLSNGIQSATYTNTGCLRGNDVITASIGTSSQTIGVGVDAANIGTIQFVSSDLPGSSIVLRGSGGLGRKEAALLTFRVLDQNNTGLGGVDVTFRATTTTGGLTVQPAKGTTDPAGFVTTTVSSGTIPTPVRIIAEASRNGKTISGLSDTLTISTGLPIQRSMSLSADKFNIEALGFDGTISNLTIRLADQYGNIISDDTAVSFITEGGAIGTAARGACTTKDGGCSVTLTGQAFRPTNGRVTVLAYLQGVENFVDMNGDGQYTCTDYLDINGVRPAVYRPLVDRCVSGGEPYTDQGDPFLDTGVHTVPTGTSVTHTLDFVYDPAKGDLPVPYDHPVYTPLGNGSWGINYISRSAEIVFSGSTASLIRQVCTSAGCRDWNTATDGAERVIQGVSGAGCSVQSLTFRIFDSLNNPMPADTKITAVDAEKIAPLTISPAVVTSTNISGGTIHTVAIKPDVACVPGFFNIKVETPKGIGTTFLFQSN